MSDWGGLILKLVQENLWLTAFVFILFVRACPRRPLFAVRLIGGLAGLLALSILYRAAEQWFPLPELVRIISNGGVIVTLLLSAAYMKLLFECNWNMVLFGTLAGLCTQELLFGIWVFITAVAPVMNTPLREFIVCCLLGAALAAALYWALAVPLTPRSLLMLQKHSLAPLLVLYLISIALLFFSTDVVIFLNVFFEPIWRTLVEIGAAPGRSTVQNVRLCGICASMAGNVLVLFALRNMLRYSEADLKKELLEQIRNQDRKQYDHFRSNVDYINTKSHDLKHYLELLQRSETLPREELERVSESLTRLDSETDSGNETLDLILTDRRLACEQQGIDLMFQTDGTRLERLDVIDTYALFCNILDNAIGYVGKLPPSERRIRLGVRTIHSMVFIHQENPLVGELEMRDGLPATTQEDETLHGFGLKSVQSIVKKWGGELVIRAGGGRFELDICFPQTGGSET